MQIWTLLIWYFLYLFQISALTSSFFPCCKTAQNWDLALECILGILNKVVVELRAISMHVVLHFQEQCQISWFFPVAINTHLYSTKKWHSRNRSSTLHEPPLKKFICTTHVWCIPPAFRTELSIVEETSRQGYWLSLIQCRDKCKPQKIVHLLVRKNNYSVPWATFVPCKHNCRSQKGQLNKSIGFTNISGLLWRNLVYFDAIALYKELDSVSHFFLFEWILAATVNSVNRQTDLPSTSTSPEP